MGWEKRGNQTYYYRKKREGGRVRSVYVGRAEQAQIGVGIIEDERLNRKAEREALRGIQQAEKEIDRQLATAGAAVYAIANAGLRVAGYHQHKGQWRRKRT